MVPPRTFPSLDITKDEFLLVKTDEAGFEEERPLMTDLVADGALAIVAGGDTTSRAIQNVFFALLSHPEHYERLKAEMDSAFSSGDGIFDIGRYTDLKFLDAVV